MEQENKTINGSAAMTQNGRTARFLTTLLVLLMTAVTAWAADVNLSVDNAIDVGTAGHYYVNMPTTGTNTLTITAADIAAGKGVFKVYDSGGKSGNYYSSDNGYLILAAPSGYVLKLSGEITTLTNDILTVYDGSTTSDAKLINGMSSGTLTPISISPSTVFSSGQSMMLHFSSDNTDNQAGLDLTVTLVSNAPSITVKSATGGSVAASVGSSAVTQAWEGSVVTLTATPENGYMLSELSVTDASSNAVAVTDMLWYASTNQATFTMPGSAVTVTPTFTNTWTADGGLYVNMPATGTKTLAIPSGVASFKVYDDGGKDGDYSLTCNGSLILTAPTGYVLQLSGSLTTLAGDPLTVYDGSGDSGTTLLNIISEINGTAITPVVSTGQSMTLYFRAVPGVSAAGLDLTVTLVSAATSSGITVNSASGGSVMASVGDVQNVTSATVNQTVTLTATPDEGNSLVNLSVTDAGGNAVVTDWEIYRNTATFRMPASDVTVTSTFSLTGDISQCTVTGLPDYVLHGNPGEMNEVFDNIVVKIGDRALTKGTDYTVKIEQKNGKRYNYYGGNTYDGDGMLYLNDEIDPVEGIKMPYWQHGDVYDEKFVVIGAGIYAGQEKLFPYKRFFLDHDYDWTHVTNRPRYLVRTADDLDHIAAAINSGLNMNYYYYVHDFILAGDIDFSGRTLVDTDNDGIADSNFTPIGTAAHPFNGTFIGSGTIYWSGKTTSHDYNTGAVQPIGFAYRTISGIVCKTKGDDPAGFFGCLASGVSVSDVTLDDCTFTASGTGVAGAIAGTVESGATVERCLVKNSTVSGTTQGAIVGTNSGTLSRNYYTGCNSSASNIGTAAGDVAGARRDLGLTVPGSLSLDKGTTHGLVFGDHIYGGATETLTFYENTFDAYTTSGPVASFTHDAANYKYALAINDDAAAAITINHANHFDTDAGADGSEEHPYVISTTAGLDFLAELVNGDPQTGNTGTSINSRYKFKDKFFKLGDNIAYDPDALTVDLDGNSINESNYTPIGIGQTDQDGELDNQGHRFLGTFDGDGQTISGIRINYPTGKGLGIFGLLGHYANANSYWGVVKNLTVSDAIIIGNGNLGGIVGYSRGSDIINCHATSTLNIQLCGDNDHWGTLAAGIVGEFSHGTVSHCTSAVTLTPQSTDVTTSLGGIAGYIGDDGKLSQNLAVGVTVNGNANNLIGAILGYCNASRNGTVDYGLDGKLVRNYYSNCTIGSATTGVGVGVMENYESYYSTDLNSETMPDGAVSGFALFDDSDNSKAIALAASAGGSIDVKLSGRTLYKDGDWNTLTLPFAISNFTGTPLEGAMVKKMETTSNLSSDGTLTLNFSNVSAIEAGKPYIVKWDKPDGYVAYDGSNAATCSDLVSPLFQGVTVTSAPPTAVTSTDTKVTFVGQYDLFEINAGNLNKIILLGSGSQLGYASEPRTLHPFRG